MADQSAERVYPFSNGAQLRNWDAHNCQRCGRQPYQTIESAIATQGQWSTSGCAIFDDLLGCGLFEAGVVLPDIARRMGYYEANPVGGVPKWTWDCPERTEVP